MPIYAFTGSLTRPMPQYGAANGQGIVRLSFDETTGRLAVVDILGGLDDTAWLLADPANKRLYTTTEVTGTQQSAIAGYAVGPEGLTLINQLPTRGNEACHASFSADGRYLLVATYNGATPEGWPDHSLTVFPVAADGTLGAPATSVRHQGSGPNKERQQTAHAHCVVPTPAGDLVYVADLGIDRLVAYAFGEDGSLTPRPERDFAVTKGFGPRHIVFQPDGRGLFLVCELNACVISIGIDPATGALSERDTFMIPSRDGGIVQPAGILLTADGRHVFAGLRVADEIIGLAVDPATGKLTQTGRWSSGGKTPRDFAFSPSGRHLIVANQDSDNLTVFEIDHERGTLSDPVSQVAVGTPMTVTIAAY